MQLRPHFSLSIILGLLTLFFVSLNAPAASATKAPVNAIIGDASWQAAHDTPPGSADEVARIRTHLIHVVGLLRGADTSSLSTEERRRRLEALDHLEEYAEAGVFPRRTPGDGYPSRQPRFIDDRGVHCAVAELIRESGEPELARAIDDRWEFAYVQDIDSPELATWAESHGFDAVELATIQPMYTPTDPVSRFFFEFVMFFIFVGWLGALVSFVTLIILRGTLVGWRDLLIVAGGWLFAALVATVFHKILPASTEIGILETAAMALAFLLQIACTWGAHLLLKKDT